MSRALDKDTVAALRSGDPDAAFRAISDVLTEGPQSAPTASSPARLEIELLGRGHPPLSDGKGSNRYFLRDGNAVAVPKLALVQAFLVAREILTCYRASSPPPHDGSSDGHDDNIMRATAVILLMDPEHLTAANTRKRIIQAMVLQKKNEASPSLDTSTPTSTPTPTRLLSRELLFVDSLLTSHLHRHTKSPTLWSHRRWLVSFSVGITDADTNHRPLGDITEVVLVAAVRHPRNYYAWDHARWLVQQQKKSMMGEEDKEDSTKLVVAVRDWCYRHHTDTSGWSFLFFLLASLSTTTPTTATTTSAPLPPLSPLYSDTIAQVEQMATSLRWTGESVWVFLRTAVAYLGHGRTQGVADASTAKQNYEQQYDRFRAAASALQASVDTASREHQILLRAQEWCAAAAKSNSHGTTNTT